ncbi:MULTISPECIES: DUF5302 domain-containing protein [unclassified Mycobacterium]|uniref:DUF5302 domain-containing protein n=1 Tax=unclassified Mycobacterium TaxID=2642494 RepID=UPI000FBBD407|nr:MULTISPECIES: DUF5302 domain-containing protein [unclassified Mycobacterium]MDP7705563.1 DUF5302 domain-containing protein [Mycobacterium sp. TY815]MDP7725010.1 DUF5302 domain-containing protein [Mycobacterium sp. TY814]RUP01698.1 MAG: hypothetical protein EKK34_28310 [Mycobacterium sp.]
MAETNAPESSEQPEDENKRKFREALERKLAKSSGGSDHKDSGGKQSRAHGAAGNRREFRRKSG